MERIVKRLKVGLEPRHIKALAELKKTYNAKTEAEVMRSALFVCYCLQQTHKEPEQTDSEYLQELFATLSNWEEQANGDKSRITKSIVARSYFYDDEQQQTHVDDHVEGIVDDHVEGIVDDHVESMVEGIVDDEQPHE